MTEKLTPRGNVRNCPWGYNCDKTWDSLDSTDDPSIRSCDACNHNVYLCKTQKDLTHAVLSNRCVAFHPKLIEAIEARFPEDDGTTLSGSETILDPSDFVVGEVDADNIYTPLNNSPEYIQMRDRVLGDTRQEFISLTMGENGDINAEVEFSGDYDREFIITIPARQVEKLRVQLDEPDTARVLGTLHANCRSTNDLTDWLDKHGIGWKYWAWPG